MEWKNILQNNHIEVKEDKMNKCFICNNDSKFYFSKQFNEFGLKRVEYFKCPQCGFVFSKTHNEMNYNKWEKLNIAFHVTVANPNAMKSGIRRPPPYFEQAAMLNVLHKNKIINLDSSIDWGSGYGTLSKILDKYYGIKIKNYDKYMLPQENSLSSCEIAGRRFKTVINSAVFEHVTKRQDLDEINSFVSEEGCLVIHTVVCEEIPQDPNWFYLLPVHCAFYTNKSMGILMDQWGYSSSIYCPTAKTWILFKNTPKNIELIVEFINMEFQANYLYFKTGFVDYWK